jgi:hypothetical protein
MLLYFTIAILFFVDIYRSLYPQDFEKYKREITDIFQPKIITLSYNVIYYYSYLQIKYNKLKLFIMPFINILCVAINNFLKNHNLINFSEPSPKVVFEIYGKGVNIKNIFLHDNNKNQINNIFNEELKICNNYDFVILSDQTKTTCTNKIHYYNFPDTFDNINYKISNIKFISMDLSYNSQIYPIELQNDTYNHYIINNKLNSEFYQYYLKNILNISIENDKFDYKVQLIDHNVNILELSPQQELLIKENDYEIININISESIEQNDEKNECVNELDSVNDSTNDSVNDYIKLELSELST